MKIYDRIAENLSKAGFSWGCSSEIDSTGRIIFTVDACARGWSPLYCSCRQKTHRIFGTWASHGGRARPEKWCHDSL